MRTFLLSAASSIHTLRWANGLARLGHDVHVVTQHKPLDGYSRDVKIHTLPFSGAFGYFLNCYALRLLIRKFKPDLLNAHYASGYGTTARLADFHPLLLSVWGSDVYDFPGKSPFHLFLLRKNLLAADKVASTSHCMAKRVLTIVPELKEVAITPFGVETSDFAWVPPLSSEDSVVVIGTVKTMAPKYGISVLLQAFSVLTNRFRTEDPEMAKRLRLRIVGDGPQLPELKRLAQALGIAAVTHFEGRVCHSQVAVELSKIHIYVALSILDSESFGVAVIEASASGRPVLVSDVDGLNEVAVNQVTGLVVPRASPTAAAEALGVFVKNLDLARRMGEAGRQHVKNNYEWVDCVKKMSSIYVSLVQGHQGFGKNE